MSTGTWLYCDSTLLCTLLLLRMEIVRCIRHLEMEAALTISAFHVVCACVEVCCIVCYMLKGVACHLSTSCTSVRPHGPVETFQVSG